MNPELQENVDIPVQFFLSNVTGQVFEVFTRREKMRCNCPGYRRRQRCKHLRYMRDAIRYSEGGKGSYHVNVSRGPTPEEQEMFIDDPRQYRTWLIEHMTLIVDL